MAMALSCCSRETLARLALLPPKISIDHSIELREAFSRNLHHTVPTVALQAIERQRLQRAAGGALPQPTAAAASDSEGEEEGEVEGEAEREAVEAYERGAREAAALQDPKRVALLRERLQQAGVGGARGPAPPRRSPHIAFNPDRPLPARPASHSALPRWLRQAVEALVALYVVVLLADAMTGGPLRQVAPLFVIATWLPCLLAISLFAPSAPQRARARCAPAVALTLLYLAEQLLCGGVPLPRLGLQVAGVAGCALASRGGRRRSCWWAALAADVAGRCLHTAAAGSVGRATCTYAACGLMALELLAAARPSLFSLAGGAGGARRA